jgi:hypothetical protein
VASLEDVQTTRWLAAPPVNRAQHVVIPLAEPSTRKGLGSRLIAPQRGIDAADLDFRLEGLACRIVVGGAVLASGDDGQGKDRHQASR